MSDPPKGTALITGASAPRYKAVGHLKGANAFALLVVVLTLADLGASMWTSYRHPAAALNPPPPKSESWDQENLKKDDQGCPTAIFTAPNGVLRQCP
jgi:hypothetical protein